MRDVVRLSHGAEFGEVHLWWGDLLEAREPVTEARIGDVLSPDERARAFRLCLARDRRRFVLARGMLRGILARYVGRAPEELRFQYAPHGKPGLACPETDLEFNLAHCEDLVLCAISGGRRVGVDVERLRPMADLARVAAAAFSRAELAAWMELDPSQRLLGFYTCWTRKEAYVKARGDGLAMPLDAFDVSLKPTDPAALLVNRLDQDEVLRWSLSAVAPAEHHVGALAVQGHGARVSLRRWRFRDAASTAVGVA